MLIRARHIALALLCVWLHLFAVVSHTAAKVISPHDTQTSHIDMAGDPKDDGLSDETAIFDCHGCCPAFMIETLPMAGLTLPRRDLAWPLPNRNEHGFTPDTIRPPPRITV